MAEESESLDLEKVRAFLREELNTIAPEIIQREVETRTKQEQHVPLATQEREAQNQLKQMLDPFITPELNAAKFAAADAKDYTDFYSRPGNSDMKDEVEKMFNELKDAGRAIPRADVKRYLLGKLHEENPQEFNKRAKATQEHIDRLNGSVDIGSGAMDKAKREALSDPWSMSLEDLEKALDGVTF